MSAMDGINAALAIVLVLLLCSIVVEAVERRGRDDA